MLRPMSAPRVDLSPRRALLHPLWLGSVAMLALNDHVLKELVPGVVTGKLSDFAGLMVAPALMAALLGVRTRRGLALAHVAVGCVFAGIQLSPAFAGAWSSLMGTVGFPWRITMDPTDLVALLMLPVSWVWLTRNTVATPDRTLRFAAQIAAAAIGLFCSVATSYDEPCDETITTLEWGQESASGVSPQQLFSRAQGERMTIMGWDGKGDIVDFGFDAGATTELTVTVTSAEDEGRYVVQSGPCADTGPRTETDVEVRLTTGDGSIDQTFDVVLFEDTNAEEDDVASVEFELDVDEGHVDTSNLTPSTAELSSLRVDIHWDVDGNVSGSIQSTVDSDPADPEAEFDWVQVATWPAE